MSGVGVEFVGGPLDGRQEIVPCDDRMRPRQSYECATAAAWDSKIVRHTYELEASPRDDGPLWLYRWASER